MQYLSEERDIKYLLFMEKKLVSVSYIGTLEHLAQENGIVSVRISCTKQIFKYSNAEYDEERPFDRKGFVNIDKRNLEGDILSCFMKGDKVELSRPPKDSNKAHHFVLKNLTLQDDKSHVIPEWLCLDF